MTRVVDFLADIIARRKARVAAEWGDMDAAEREHLASAGRESREFEAALAWRRNVGVIAEVKKASPSVGSIAPGADAAKQALRYERGGAAAVSVLTEPESFGGSFVDLSNVAGAVDLPVLCKDFVVDPVQLYVARGHGADAILLMVSVLGEHVSEYLLTAETLGLEALVEVHDEAEFQTALEAGARVVGVNSRNLRDLSVDVAGALVVVEMAAFHGLVVVAESGVRSREQVEAAAGAGAHAVLIGESLMRAASPEEVLKDLTDVPRRGAGRS